MPTKHQSSLVRAGILLCSWVVLVCLAAFRISAADVGFRNHADLVVVPLTVTNRNGKAVAGLEASQFRVLDNGEARPVVSFEPDQRPLSIVVVVDTSARLGSRRQQ